MPDAKKPQLSPGLPVMPTWFGLVSCGLQVAHGVGHVLHRQAKFGPQDDRSMVAELEAENEVVGQWVVE